MYTINTKVPVIRILLVMLFLYFRFDGRVVAKLPFHPISWIQGLSHRNLPGDDYTDCSFIFLYILCTMSIRLVGCECIVYFILQKSKMFYRPTKNVFQNSVRNICYIYS